MRPGLRDDLVAVGFPEAQVATDDYCEALAASTVGRGRLAGLQVRRAFEPALVLGIRVLIWSVRLARRLVAILSRR